MEELLHESVELVYDSIFKINQNELHFLEAEEKVLQFVNKLGHLMMSQIAENLTEPTTENTTLIDNEKAVYKDMSNLRFKTRFGDEIVKSRRVYQVEGQKGVYCPLDEKIGMDKCSSFSPFMTYLIALFGACEGFASAAKKLSKTIGFNISSTAVQNNTEKTGQMLNLHPYKAISDEKQNEESDLMIVEIDGTTSPQIHQEEGITGRESLKQPTEYKECNVVVIEKQNNGQKSDRWVGAQYGNRKDFETHVRQTGLKMGQLKAKKVVFVADGAKHNWEIQKNNFPSAVPILDIYHAFEHLSDFCTMYKDNKQGKAAYTLWKSMIYEGQILQVLEDMKDILYKKITNPDEGQKHINYFSNNKERMEYDQYRDAGFPNGSGLVEGQCKLVVNRRFKGNGMRWKLKDNKAVLNVRIAVLNDILDKMFIPNPRKFKLAS